MEVEKYLGKLVRVDLTNGFYYSGKVLSVGKDNSITLKDKYGQLVTLSEKSILFIREVVN